MKYQMKQIKLFMNQSQRMWLTLQLSRVQEVSQQVRKQLIWQQESMAKQPPGQCLRRR